MKCACHQCGNECEKDANAINRANKIGAKLFCGKVCFGLSRRRKVPLTEEQRKAAKADYDSKRRVKLADRIKAEKAARHKRTYDPVKAAVVRAARMPQHIEYCRRPEYKVKKAEYDRRKRFQAFGPFADAAMLLEDLEREISTRATRYEIYIANGRFTRSAQQRRRELWQTIRSNRT